MRAISDYDHETKYEHLELGSFDKDMLMVKLLFGAKEALNYNIANYLRLLTSRFNDIEENMKRHIPEHSNPQPKRRNTEIN